MDPVVSKFLLSFSSDSESSYGLAMRTVEMVRSLVDSDNWSTADQLIKNVKSVNTRLEEELPHKHVSHNVIK